MKTNSHLIRTLPYAGALPFMSGAILLVIGIGEIPLFGNVETIISSYGLAIVSFMAGVHWGQYLAGIRTRVNLLISSNVVTLVAWFGFVLLPHRVFYILLIILFILLNFIDGHLREDDMIDLHYGQTRRNVTAIVCCCLALLAII